MSTTTTACPRRHCGHAADIRTDGMGRVTLHCSPCERNARGLCRDCPRRLDQSNANALRCLDCSEQHRRSLERERSRARYPIRRAQVLKQHKAYAAQPTVREHRRRYMGAYRAKHPRDWSDRAYGRAYMAKRRADPPYLARQNKRRRQIRAEKKKAAAIYAADRFVTGEIVS